MPKKISRKNKVNIQKGGDPDEFETELLVACSVNDIETIDELLANQQFGDLQSLKDPTSILLNAIEGECSLEVIQKLYERFDKNMFNIDSQNMNERAQTLLMIACAKPGIDIKIIEFLISLNPNLSLIDNEGNDALTYALISGNLSAAQLLLAHGAQLRPEKINYIFRRSAAKKEVQKFLNTNMPELNPIRVPLGGKIKRKKYSVKKNKRKRHKRTTRHYYTF